MTIILRLIFCFPTQGRTECEERTRKKAEKRKRKKKAKAAGPATKQAKTDPASKALPPTSSGGGSSSSDGDAAEEFVYIPVADQAASGGDGGGPAAFKNDGSFLEKMKKELKLEGTKDAGKTSDFSRIGAGLKTLTAK